jgi:hypothetical protein
MKCGAIFIGGPAHDECGECATPARESVADALMIVESYGPWGADLNDAHRRQIVLADEVLRLRGLYEMAVNGRAGMRGALRAERMREAGFTRRPSAKSLPSDE